MKRITVDLWLYGPLAQYGGPERRASYAHRAVELAPGSTLGQLLAALGLPTEERGITLINGQLSALPGLQPDLDRPLADGDRVALFHLRSMWPYQYRDGASLSADLAAQLGDTPFHARPRTE